MHSWIQYIKVFILVYNEERKSKNDPDKDIEDSGFHEYSRP